jgi:glycosyltransferase involved in cell wall biosynthesis
MSPLYGGPFVAVKGMAEAVASLGAEVDVATTTANGKAELDAPLDRLVVEEGVRYFYFQRQYPKVWTFSFPLTRWLGRHASKYDVLHVHVPFSYPTLFGCQMARRHSVPYVLMPHGTLDPWALRFRRWKKAPYFLLFERANILGAAAVHAVSAHERHAIEALGLPARVVTIPLGIDPPAEGDEGHGASRKRKEMDGTVNILFLSRLHPKKGIEILLDAARLLQQRDKMRFFIAGEGEEAYVRSLQDRAAAYGLEKRVTFTGFVSGAAKRRLFQEAHLFVLPSYDENFGMAVAEALSFGLPVVISEHVALAEQVAAVGAGSVVPCDAGELARALATLVADPDLCQRMGEAGRRLAQAEFSWPEIAKRLIALYEEVRAARTHVVRSPPG